MTQKNFSFVKNEGDKKILYKFSFVLAVGNVIMKLTLNYFSIRRDCQSLSE